MTKAARALARARDLAQSFPAEHRPSFRSDTPDRIFAIGDPQAPLETFLAILEQHGALGDDGWLATDLHLISMGDHFDWGSRAERERAAADGLALLSWLAAHPVEQVTVLAGNHDLARVGELNDIDDETFQAAQALADAAYYSEDDAALARFREQHANFATAELVARDLSTFRTEQRALVQQLLDEGRLRFAHSAAGMLFVHAGITTTELDALQIGSTRDAELIAARLNQTLDEAVARRRRDGGPLVVDHLHFPGDGTREGGGALYHRPTLGLDEEEQQELTKAGPRRRFHVDTLPRGLVQVVGHIRDKKTRSLLAPLTDGSPAQDGLLRTLVLDHDERRYRHGVTSGSSKAATVIFTDGGMSHVQTRPEAYQILDVNNRKAAER